MDTGRFSEQRHKGGMGRTIRMNLLCANQQKKKSDFVLDGRGEGIKEKLIARREQGGRHPLVMQPL